MGFYNRAYQLIRIPTDNLNSAVGGNMAFSALSRIQDDPPRLKSYFLKGYSLVLALTLPITIACALFADDLVFVLLGPKWRDAAPIFRLLAPTILVFAIANPWVGCSNALGIVPRGLGIAASVMAPLMIVGYVLGLPYGPQGVAFAYSLVMTVCVVPIVGWAVRGTGVSVADILQSAAPPLIFRYRGGGSCPRIAVLVRNASRAPAPTCGWSLCDDGSVPVDAPLCNATENVLRRAVPDASSFKRRETTADLQEDLSASSFAAEAPRTYRNYRSRDLSLRLSERTNRFGQGDMLMSTHRKKPDTGIQATPLTATPVVALLFLALFMIGGCKLPSPGSGSSGSMMITLTKSLTKDLTSGDRLTVAAYNLSGTGPSRCDRQRDRHNELDLQTDKSRGRGMDCHRGRAELEWNHHSADLSSGHGDWRAINVCYDKNCLPIIGNGTLGIEPDVAQRSDNNTRCAREPYSARGNDVPELELYSQRNLGLVDELNSGKRLLYAYDPTRRDEPARRQSSGGRRCRF